MTNRYIIVRTDSSSINIVKNLLQAYEAEFSVFTKKLPDSKGIYPLDVDLEDYQPYLLYEDKTPIGFALKGTQNNNHDIADFYIIPTHRKTGAGYYFASELFKKYKGPWQARQIENYSLGRDFALGVLAKFLKTDQFREEVIHDHYWGKITIQYFESK